MTYFERRQRFERLRNASCFLWGPRQTGKSTLLKHLFPDAPTYDLLLSEEYFRFSRQPGLLREEVLSTSAKGKPVIVDEIQKIPELLDEIHWLMENHHVKFIISGSSPRKIMRKGANLSGGRLLRYELFPFVSYEIPDFDLQRAINHGMLPPHYLAEDSAPLLRSYVGDYLKEVIAQEGDFEKHTFLFKIPGSGGT